MDDDRRVERSDLLIRDGRIAEIGADLSVGTQVQEVDASGQHVLPGLIQAHVHLGQSLFRGLAEGRELLPWLQERIWPLEAAHDVDSAYWSGMLGAADCLLSGTTTIQDIGLVHQMESIFRAISDSGLRAVAGKCLMDRGFGPLEQAADQALDEAEQLIRTWQGHDDRITGAVCPRFILSCSRDLWEGAVELAERVGAPLHTHLLEHPQEEMEVRAALGQSQMDFLEGAGVLDADLRIAHGVGFKEPHRVILDGRPMKVAHCPSANLKLGSGIADLPYLRSIAGLDVGIGCDGAACNNDLDVLEEIRLAALLQHHHHPPGMFTAFDALCLATRDGARAVGLASEIGSLEVGKRADLVALDLERPATFGAAAASVYDRIVYGAGRDSVQWVMVGGRFRVRDGKVIDLDHAGLLARAGEAVQALLARADLP